MDNRAVRNYIWPFLETNKGSTQKCRNLLSELD